MCRSFAANLQRALDDAGPGVRGRAAVRDAAAPGGAGHAAWPRARPDTTEEHRGPPVSSAFDGDGNPTKAAEGFARKHGVAVGELERRTAGKAQYLFHSEHRAGRATAGLLPELVARVLHAAAGEEAHALGRARRDLPAPGALGRAAVRRRAGRRRAARRAHRACDPRPSLPSPGAHRDRATGRLRAPAP
ncbi:MAG: glycine--tRNA ligase subunit beta [Halofilum sp. (in: g-proteobacteria)]|nr:glycine--tRNA ligase subunit beta [Halofilum sp. (in: g-proteobacteria)]